MNTSILDDPMMQMIYNETLKNLSNGVVSPIDKKVLSSVPLPENFIEPYTSQSVEARSAMDLTNNSLSVWIEEAKKANYFTKHFVTLSKMILSGVTTMARGLMTLHVCGEDLSSAPMSIQDLISLSSYHIRKSYLGVLQTSRSNPEIGERLLLNQLSWTNTLLRLYRTKEKLEAKPEIKTKKSEISGKTPKQLPDSGAVEAFEPFSDGERAFSGAGTISAHGGFGAAKAFEPMEEKGSGNKVQGSGKVDRLPGENEKSEMINEKSNDSQPKENQKSEMIDEKSDDSQPDENVKFNDAQVSGEGGAQESDIAPESTESMDHDVDAEEIRVESKETNPEDSSLNQGDFSPSSHEKPPASSQAVPIPGTPYGIDPERPPEYFRILYQAVCRGRDSGEEGVSFTEDEVYQLLADPEFCFFEKELASEFRRILENDQIRA